MISKRVVDAFLRRELNSFLWMKRLKLEDFLSEYKHYKVKPYFKTTPWLHQHVMFHLGMCNPYFLFLYDMGTGKTKGILDLITQVQREGRLKRALVTVNGQLTTHSWDKAIAVHSDLHPIIVDCENIEEKWERLIVPKGDIAVIDYAGLHLALSTKQHKGKHALVKDEKKIRQLQKLYNFYNGDESHKIKNEDTLRYSILRQLTKPFDFRYCMTGTPMGRNPVDVFAQFYMVDRGETFSDTLGMFRECFFVEKPHPWKGIEYVFNRRREKLFQQFMQNKSLRYTDSECSDIPVCQEIPMEVEFSREQREHYLRAVQGLINAGGKYADIDNSYLRMRQIVSGFLHWKDAYGEHTVRIDNNPKLEMLEEMLDASGNEKIVISYEYTESARIILEKLIELKIGYEWVWGGSRDDSIALDRFITDPSKRVFLMNSESGGTGTDGLQGVARYLFFWESPPSPITRRQVIKRLDREGQKKRTYIYDIIVKDSIDIHVLDFIAEGMDLHEVLINGNGKAKNILLL